MNLRLFPSILCPSLPHSFSPFSCFLGISCYDYQLPGFSLKLYSLESLCYSNKQSSIFVVYYSKLVSQSGYTLTEDHLEILFYTSFLQAQSDSNCYLKHCLFTISGQQNARQSHHQISCSSNRYSYMTHSRGPGTVLLTCAY